MSQREQYSPLILIYTEGKHDALLIKRLQSIYRTSFRIRQGNGSTPEIIINECLKEAGDFDIRYCVIDGDKIVNGDQFLRFIEDKLVGIKYKLIVIISYPCIEAINLALLFGDNSGFNKKNCGVLKNILKDKLNGATREEYYKNNLDKELINQNKHLLENHDFNELITLFHEQSSIFNLEI